MTVVNGTVRPAFSRAIRLGRPTSIVATASVGGSDYMTWEQLREMTASGLVDIGSQSVNHHPMSELPPEP